VNLALEQVFPNPAVSFFRVSFTLTGNGPANLDLFDVAGRRVTHRELGELGPGRHQANLERGPGLPPGIYSLRLEEAGHSVTTRVVLVQ
jgi:type IX secretion system substrate protein